MNITPHHSPKPMTEELALAINALKEGKVVLLLDARDRENEGDLIVAGEKITPHLMNFLIKKGSGVVCLALPKARLDELNLPLMISDNTNFFKTAFTLSIEAKNGVTTGVSARDRAHTINVAMNDDCKPSDLARPGHVFPLSACVNGVFDRMGHTEGSVDLVRLAGLRPGAVLCELMNEDGSMTMGEERILFAKRFGIPVVSVEEIFCYRLLTEDVFEKSTKSLATPFGDLEWHRFNFFDTFSVEIFERHTFKASSSKPARISIASGDRFFERFLAQVLDQSLDDSLVHSFTELKNDRCDVVIMASIKETPGKTEEEQRLRKNASICRSLLDLGINCIDKNTISEELTFIGKSYFSLTLN